MSHIHTPEPWAKPAAVRRESDMTPLGHHVASQCYVFGALGIVAFARSRTIVLVIIDADEMRKIRRRS